VSSEGAGSSRSYTSLFWRVFATNAVILSLAAAVTVVVLSPGVFSQPVAVKELAILIGGLAVMVVVNLLLVRRIVAPLGELMALMRSADPVRPGARVTVSGPPSEATELAETFNEMLERLETEREQSTRRALAAQESERLRVAQELHDEVGQNLTAALLQLGQVKRRAPAELEDDLDAAQETVRTNLDELRRIAHRLRPEALDELGLVSALAGFSERLGEQAGLRVTRRLERDLAPLDYERELVIYRIAQEALTNVVRHAQAGEVELSLAGTTEGLTLRVLDDGRGLVDAPGPASGIRGMYERALLIEADLHVGERPQGGTEVRLEVPLVWAPV
jgi:two-component system sensor histidine kinase UhpB